MPILRCLSCWAKMEASRCRNRGYEMDAACDRETPLEEAAAHPHLLKKQPNRAKRSID